MNNKQICHQRVRDTYLQHSMMVTATRRAPRDKLQPIVYKRRSWSPWACQKTDPMYHCTTVLSQNRCTVPLYNTVPLYHCTTVPLYYTFDSLVQLVTQYLYIHVPKHIFQDVPKIKANTMFTCNRTSNKWSEPIFGQSLFAVTAYLQSELICSQSLIVVRAYLWSELICNHGLSVVRAYLC